MGGARPAEQGDKVTKRAECAKRAVFQGTHGKQGTASVGGQRLETTCKWGLPTASQQMQVNLGPTGALAQGACVPCLWVILINL